MAEKKLTIFQRLNKVFGPEGVKVAQEKTNRYHIGKDEILKTTSKQEFETTKKQAQQNRYISQLWQKVDGEMYQQSIHYEVTRIGSYSDFESMEFFPEIAAALDIMMEEATTPNDKGKILNVYSESSRVKSILEDLFMNRLDCHTNLPAWTRNLCKFGDDFVFLNIDDKAGIIGARQMPNFEMERREGDLYNMLLSRSRTVNNDGTPKTEYDNKVKFYWRTKDVEFNSWQIAHFRLLGDDRKLPYGTCLKSDSYINTEDGIKEIKNVKIGDKVFTFDPITQKNTLSIVLDTVNSGVKETYKLSTKHNYVDASKEHRIMYFNLNTNSFDYKNVLDFKLGDLLVINQQFNLNKKIKIDKSLPIDYDKSQNYSEKNRYWKNIDLIPDYVDEDFAELFGFLLGDGCIDYKKNTIALALGVEPYLNEKYINLLEKYSGCNIKENKTVAKCYSKLLITILSRLGFNGNAHTKRLPQWVFEAEVPIKEAVINGLYEADGSINIDKWNCARYEFELANEMLVKDIKMLVQSLGYKSGKISSRLRKATIIKGKLVKNAREAFSFYYYKSKNKQIKKYEINNRLNDGFILEPIQSIESIGEYETHDIYIENENHNFYANGVVVHNSVLEKARRIWKQCLDEDTLIWSKYGYKKIKDIVSGDTVYSFVKTDSGAGVIPNKVVDCWQTGNKDVYEVRTRYGAINVTNNHKLLCLTKNGNTEYKTINEVIIDSDKLITPTLRGASSDFQFKQNEDDYYIKLNKFGLKKSKLLERIKIVQKLKEISETDYKNIHRFLQGKGKIKYKYFVKLKQLFDFNTNDIDLYFKNTISTLVDKELYFKPDVAFLHFFGFMLGDGWLIKNGVGFALGIYEDRNEYYIKYVKENLKSKIRISQSKRSEYSKSVLIDSLELKMIFKRLGFITGFAHKEIPMWMFMLPLNEKRKIIEGLFDADGSHKYGVIGLANKKLITDLRELCLQSGIACGKIGVKPASTKFNNKTGKTEVRQESYKLYINFNNVKDDVRYENILSINKVGIKPVWDLSVEGNPHNFVANDFVVHNCLLSEDAMLIYRVTRAPERRIYKIYVGNIDDADVGAYVNEIASRFKRLPVVDPATGQIDLRYNQLGQDQDIFIPVRDESAPSPIDTLPGATNLNEIADIQYLQNKLFTALRVPKPFLGFDAAVGEGKNLALMDIRFSRTINRIQQAILMELNKIAIIHLYLLGFEDDLDNFILTLNNPSTQAEMLKIEHLQMKVTLYKDAVSDAGNGFAAMSMTKGKKEILGFSDEEIKQDLLEQRIEKAAAAELAKTSALIKKTGFFEKVDNIYADPKMKAKLDAGEDIGGGEEGAEGAEGGGFGGSGSFGGGGFGGEEFGAEEESGGINDEGGMEGEAETEAGGEPPIGGETGTETPMESLKKAEKLLMEQKNKLNQKLQNKVVKYQSMYIDKLINSKIPENILLKESATKIMDKNLKINDNINNMIDDINKKLRNV